MYKVQVKRKAAKNIEQLALGIREAVIELLQVLEKEPIPYMDFDVVKLRGRSNDYRVRIGSLRVIYSVDWEEMVIIISRADSRGRVYK